MKLHSTHGWLGVFVMSLVGCGSSSKGASCGAYSGDYVAASGTCLTPFTCSITAECVATCSDGATVQIRPKQGGFDFTTPEGASCSATLANAAISGTCVSGASSCSFGATFTPSVDPGAGTGGSASSDACTMQVQTGTRTECDWSYGISDPDIACSDVPVYSDVSGVLCGGTCTDTNSSGEHCGSCDSPCSGGLVCQSGSCVAAGTGGAGGGSGTGGSGAGGSGSGGSASGGSGGSTDPCSAFPDSSNGYACGANLGLGGTSNLLYYCSNFTTAGSVTCKSGCHASALGSPDYCNDSDPCSNSPWNGVACGSNLSPLANANRLYTCSNQATVTYVDCQAGCYAAPLGSEDSCNAD